MVAAATAGRKKNRPDPGADAPEQGDLFRCDITNWPVKDDMASMEYPIFSLSKNKDMEIREYRRGNKVVRVIPSGVGAATVFDKDLLLYIASQIVAAKNEGKPTSRKVVIDSCDFLLATERGDGRASFERILDMLRRLKGTILETNVPTGGTEKTEGFGIIEDYALISSRSRKETKPGASSKASRDIPRVIRFEVMLSQWLYDGLMNYEVLTMDRGYFLLTRSIERRLYEIARKYCGDKPYWLCNIDLVAEKLGTRVSRAKFRDEIRQAIKADSLPEYRVALDTGKKPDDVVFYTRNNGKLHKELLRNDDYAWFSGLERHNVFTGTIKNTREKQPAIGDV